MIVDEWTTSHYRGALASGALELVPDGRRHVVVLDGQGMRPATVFEVALSELAAELASELEKFARFADVLEQPGSTVGPSPLYAVREECEAARDVLRRLGYREED